MKDFKQFNELSECELNDLRQQIWDRAVEKKRELLFYVRCVWQPLTGCKCGCNKSEKE